MKKIDCVGCRDNFYNGNNDLGVEECWSFEASKRLVTRYRLPTTTPMNIRSAYVKVRVPPCYHVSGYVYLSEIPSYAV